MIRDTDVIQHIQDLCNKRGWTSYRLSKESGIPMSTLSNMTLRTTIPSIPTLQKICYAFGITLSDFFADEINEMHLTKQQIQLLKNYGQLNSEERRLATAYILGLLKQL